MAAAWVVLEHFRQPISALLHPPLAVATFIASGHLGVEIFFILSGFIISHNYARSLSSFSTAAYKRFLQLRFARLYPVHLMTFLAAGALFAGSRLAHVALNSDIRTGPTSALMNVLMLQAVPPAHGWDQPSWSISCEAGAYVAFPLLAVLLARCTTRLTSLAGVVAGLTVSVGALALMSSLGSSSSTSYPAMWSRIVGEFSTGCFLWAYWRNFIVAHRRWDAVALISGASIVAITAVLKGPEWLDMVTLPLIALCVVAVSSSAGVVTRLLSHRVAMYGGKISYSLYMTHFLVLMVVGKLLPWTHETTASLPARLATLAVYTALVAGTAAITYHLVEVPGRRLLSRPRAAASAVSIIPSPRTELLPSPLEPDTAQRPTSAPQP